MRVSVLQISWHDQKPVFTTDCAPNGLLATGGADNNVRVWHTIPRVKAEDGSDAPVPDGYTAQGALAIRFLATLSRHAGPVNIVRFNPRGDILATGSDDNFIFLWRRTDAEPAPGSGEVEVWRVFKSFHGHRADVSDLSWSADGSMLLSGSMDNNVVLWNARGDDNRPVQTLEDHTHYVQGVAWDPRNKYALTYSSDRTFRVYDLAITRGKYNASSKAVVKRREVTAKEGEDGAAAAGSSSSPVPPEGGDGKAKKKRQFRGHGMFADENERTFFRRLAWAPDGSFFVVPTGLIRNSHEEEYAPTAYVFARGAPTAPAANLNLAGKVSTCVRFSPKLYYALETEAAADGAAGEDAQAEAEPPFFDLPYRMIFAVGTTKAVVVYDTSQSRPIAYITDVHCSAITDLSWSRDGAQLFIASEDGYLSVAAFDDGELGYPLLDHELPDVMRQSSATASTTSTAVDMALAAGATTAQASAVATAGASAAVTTTSTTHGDHEVIVIDDDDDVAPMDAAPTTPKRSAEADAKAAAPKSSPVEEDEDDRATPTPSPAKAEAKATSPGSKRTAAVDGTEPVAKKPRRVAPTFVSSLPSAPAP